MAYLHTLLFLHEYYDNGYEGPIKRNAKRLTKLVAAGAALSTGAQLAHKYQLGHHADSLARHLLHGISPEYHLPTYRS